jgi:Skp family chaperone for outer membrane proteins
VKRFTLSLLTIAVLATVSFATAQDGRAKAPKKTADPSSVALIDMAHVFQNYEKFKVLREGLQAAVQQSDAEAKRMAESFQALQQKLAEQSKQLDPGSDEYGNIEQRLLDEKGKFESWRAGTQRKLARRETDMLKVIYSDVSKMVGLYARHAEYSLVLRFNSKGVEDEMQPKQAIQAMNRNVIYHEKGNDITEVVLSQLNKQYKKSSVSTPARTTGQSRDVN